MRGFANAAGICGKRACKSLNPSSEYLREFWFNYKYEGYENSKNIIIVITTKSYNKFFILFLLYPVFYSFVIIPYVG
jgi:hypothetical protein